MGAGDNMPQCLQQMGYQVTLLKNEDLNPQNLKQYQTIVCGIRLYNVNAELDNLQTNLLKYVENGGNLIVQYNTNSPAPTVKNIAPYPLKISRERVTEQNATMTITNPKHPILNTPNTIATADFEGWVQERGLYFVSDFDKSKFETLFTLNDTNQTPNEGSTVVCRYQKGTYIYTSLSFFRQLPAGVEGAYRLFANMIEWK